ncbi:MAG: 2,3-diphosphoglycerate-dependent phosphoglycerate mutase [Gammaproteobacteria bacterium]|nr:2,3-diphosphoglycerate-dependent phosphoglycerate mutase [Gammaproteobacteria bacterium]
MTFQEDTVPGKLILVRHGQSIWNVENLFTGWVDIDLSDQGRAEAAQAGRELLAEGIEPHVAFTSVLKRAIRTLWILLDTMDRMWIPTEPSWRLNERHYGALQGLDKAQTAAQHGEAQVKIWRRSYDIPPPPLAADDPRHPRFDPRYAGVDPRDLPACESLKDTLARVKPDWQTRIAPQLAAGRNVLVVAHGNSLRALVKMLDGMSESEIVEFNMPTGVPLLYEFTPQLQSTGRRFLGDAAAIAAAQEAVRRQGEKKG